MALRGVAPDAIEKRLKALFYGPAGSGKTWTALGFPSPYLIDTERGAENPQYVKRLKDSGGAYFATPDFEEMMTEIRGLLTEKHPYRTLIIDPLTVVYNELCERAAKQLAAASKEPDSDGTEFGRHKAKADRQVRHLLNLLLRLDMNVIITAHSKTKWEKDGGSFKEAGQTFDCYSKLDYLFDLVFEVQHRGGDNRVGIVRKTRCEGFPLATVFPFTFDEIATRYGRDILERGSKPLVIVSAERLERLEYLCDVLHVEEPVREKWLTKAGAESIADLPADVADKIIKSLEAKVASAPKQKAEVA